MLSNLTKGISFIYIAGIAFFATLYSCKKKPVEDLIPYRYDVPVLFSAETDNYLLRKIEFNLKIAVLKGNNQSQEDVTEYTGIPDTSFFFQDYMFNNTWVRHNITNCSYLKDTQYTGYFSSIMLDQSSTPESFDLNDKNNLRFAAINGFLNKLKGDAFVLLSGFSRNGKLNGTYFELCSPQPVSVWDKTTARNLLDLTHKTGGTSCLFDALGSMITYMSAYSYNNKSITVMIINADDGLGNDSLESIIQKARNNNIKINLIWLIDNYQYVNFPTLTQLPCRTGGFLIYMGDIYQASTIFLGLDMLLKRNISHYNLDVTLTIDSPNYFLEKYTTGVKIYYPQSSYYTWSYIPFFLSKYDN